ncbi:hypothetical protein BJ165DRAFT_1447999 [Panaeolus papilionaceus]|nr:hypothetical protein BJ165DRAFT_1447999 [Panaeolus papilionaceus]
MHRPNVRLSMLDTYTSHLLTTRRLWYSGTYVDRLTARRSRARVLMTSIHQLRGHLEWLGVGRLSCGHSCLVDAWTLCRLSSQSQRRNGFFHLLGRIQL